MGNEIDMTTRTTGRKSLSWPVIITALALGLLARFGWASGETVNLGLGDLDPGQQVVITFDVTVDSRPPGFTQVCNQGAVSGSNHTSLLTDDPAVSGSADPTCTAVPLPPGGKVTLIKSVVNDHGGSAGVNDFGMSIDGTPVNSGAALNFAAGSVVAINEVGLAGYSFVSITGAGCPAALGGTIAVNVGDDTVCTITNDDQAPSLTLVKVAINDNGGTATATDWTLSASGPTPLSGAGGASSGATFAAGTYTLSETGPSGYAVSSWICAGGGSQNGNQITLGLGESATCTITNNDIQPTLKVIKNVVNDNGGTAVAADFTMAVSGTSVSSTGFPGDAAGTTVTLNAGSYSVSESGPSGYQSSLSADCAGTIGIGENLTCTVTNDDKPASIVIVEDTLPDGQQDFSFSITGGLVPAGFDLDDDADGTLPNTQSYTSVAPGFYTVTQTAVADYTTTLSCADTSGGTATASSTASINLAPGETVTCTFSNSHSTPPIAIPEPNSLIYLLSFLACMVLVSTMRGRERRRD